MQRILTGLALCGCVSIAYAQGIEPQMTSDGDLVAPAGADCGLLKSPDQGAFWQPLGPTGSYVYANSFVPCEDGQVDELGTWLLDQGGTGGPDVRFEVWGSIGGNAANGPDAGNVIASTGSLSLAGTPNLDFYSAPATVTGTVDAGTTYWFVATCVNEGGDGSWQVGAHTQNSEGIVDNGTFWFSNDPAGINFDGQGFTPEMAFEVTVGGGGPTPDAGYYTDFNTGSTDPEAGLVANGLTPVQIMTLTGFDLSGLDVLVINESANGAPSDDVLDALPDIQDWVEDGGKLIVHDRFVSGGGLENNPFFIGAPGMLAMRDFANDADIDIQTTGTDVTEGSFGTLDDASLDGGNSSSHGFVDAGTLPTQQSVAILERGGAPSEIVSLSYTLGNGAVYYSTIPLDFYLAGGGNNPPGDAMRDIYYPNVIEYMIGLSGGPSGGTLYFSEDGNFDGLYSIDTGTGAATNLGESGVTSSSVGLAPSPNDDELYGSTWTDLAVIQTDGSGHSVVGTSNAEGLAYDAANDILYGAINGNFFSIDQNTGAQTPLSGPGEDVEGIAFGNGVVYGLADSSGNLYSYDPGTDSWSFIGSTGVTAQGSALAYDPGEGVLYTKSTFDTNLYMVNPANAAASVVGDTGIANGGGLAFIGGEKAPCFADCDENGVLNILDFVCYQGKFQSGDPDADCDGNGVLNILDFVCFQQAFQAGCP